MENKLKIGDRVKIRNDLKGGNIYGGLYFDSGMEQYNGKTYTITDVTGANNYNLDIKDSGYCWAWNDAMVELVEPESFTKADLKPGMVVEYRCGDRALVIGDSFLKFDSNMRFREINDDLTLKNPRTFIGTKPAYDITKVYTVKKGSPLDLHDVFRDLHIELIWERKEAKPYKEMTVAEIEEKLGHKVKIVDGE